MARLISSWFHSLIWSRRPWSGEGFRYRKWTTRSLFIITINAPSCCATIRCAVAQRIVTVQLVEAPAVRTMKSTASKRSVKRSKTPELSGAGAEIKLLTATSRWARWAKSFYLRPTDKSGISSLCPIETYIVVAVRMILNVEWIMTLTYVHIYIYIYTCTHIYIYIYIYIYII